MYYKEGQYLEFRGWIIKILSFSSYYVYHNRHLQLYRFERICDKKGFAPHKSIRYSRYATAIAPNIPILENPPVVKRNWLWDKKLTIRRS